MILIIIIKLHMQKKAYARRIITIRIQHYRAPFSCYFFVKQKADLIYCNIICYVQRTVCFLLNKERKRNKDYPKRTTNRFEPIIFSFDFVP